MLSPTSFSTTSTNWIQTSDHLSKPLHYTYTSATLFSISSFPTLSTELSQARTHHQSPLSSNARTSSLNSHQVTANFITFIFSQMSPHLHLSNPSLHPLKKQTQLRQGNLREHPNTSTKASSSYPQPQGNQFKWSQLQLSFPSSITTRDKHVSKFNLPVIFSYFCSSMFSLPTSNNKKNKTSHPKHNSNIYKFISSIELIIFNPLHHKPTKQSSE